MGTSKDGDEGTTAVPFRIRSKSSSHASENDRGDEGNQRVSHGFIQPSDPTDPAVGKLNPSNSGSSIASMNVASNYSCKPEVSVVKLPETVGSSNSLEEAEGRQETSPHPQRNPSSSNIKELEHSSTCTSSRQKASPSPDQLDEKQTSLNKRRSHKGPPTRAFRPQTGYHPAPPSYQQHYAHDPHFRYLHHPPYMSGPPTGRHYYGYATPHPQRYPAPLYHPMPASSARKQDGLKPESSYLEDAEGLPSVKCEDKEAPTASSDKRIDSLPLKKRKMIEVTVESSECIGTIKAISTDDHDSRDKVSESADDSNDHDDHAIGEHQRWEEEEYYARFHTPRYGGPPYQLPYHHSYGHYYSPYYPPESDYYSPPRSNHRRVHHLEPSRERHHRHLQHKSVSPIDEVCKKNSEPKEKPAEGVKEEQEYSSRMDKLATAAGTLEIKSEASVKAEEKSDEDSDDDMAAQSGPNKKKCTPICSSLLSKFLQKKETTLSLPAFAEIVNFPQFLPEKGSPSKKSNGSSGNPPKIPSEKPCVMCGVTCIFAGTTPSRLHAQSKQSVIPKQNKGLCNSCDGKTWIFSELNAPIKWCKGCKNFRLLQNFGDKYRATKCVRCRKRQRENYAELKRKRDAQYEGANLLVQQKSGWGSASDESERGSPELDAALGLASLIC